MAYADSGTVQGSNILDDLSADSTFSTYNYPINETDYSLSVITVTESIQNELLIYVYQPAVSRDFRAAYISLTTENYDDINPEVYALTFCNSDGSLYKYLVKDFIVDDDNVRYYNIYSIFRPFDSSIDTQANYDNTIDCVSYSVAKCWEFGEINGNAYVNCTDIETIVITDKFVGFVRYMDGFKLYTGACDSHFVAFNTDRQIDKLLEADVYYTQQSCLYVFAAMVGARYDFGEEEDKYAYLKFTDKVTHSGGGLFAGTYSWDRIETVEHFIQNENMSQNVYSGALINVNVANKITDDGVAALSGKEWLLRFAETDYALSSGGGTVTAGSSLVGDVTILRLKFETDGITYNLGCIDNMQTGGSVPVNISDISVSLSDEFKEILFIIGMLILIMVLIVVLPYIFKLINFIWKILTAPLRWIFKRSKNTANNKYPSAPSNVGYVKKYKYRR